MSLGEIILYQTDDGLTKVSFHAVDGTVWLAQAEIAQLFDTTKQNVSLHLKNIFAQAELTELLVVKDSLTTAADGKTYSTKLYNLDAILAVGYRVRSPRGTQFRKWANTVLKEYLVKGFAMNDERLKQVDQWDYFDEWLARIRDIRAWEEKLDAFLQFNEHDLLTHAGKVKMEVAQALVSERYEAFDAERRKAEALAADAKDLEEIEAMIKKVGKGDE